jgi:glutaredoxin
MAAKLEGHAIYGYPQCPFCGRVTRALDSLGLEIEFRNTLESPEYLEELIDATGRTTVPVLRIESEEGEVRWMPESADIIGYLERLAEN